jgi:hypothetical protein
MKTKLAFKAVLLAAMMFCSVFPRLQTRAAGNEVLPVFSDFVAAVTNGQPDVIRGIYVQGEFAFKVVQQPVDQPGLVVAQEGVVTQFEAASLNNVIGLLAHNNLAGAYFSDLRVGQEIRIVYGDSRIEYFQVSSIARVKAEQPENPYGTFLDWKSNTRYNAEDIFNIFYKGSYHLTLQTCILRDGIASWGRLFVTALPLSILAPASLEKPERMGFQKKAELPLSWENSINSYPFH